MLNKNDLEGLRSADITRVVYAINTAFRGFPYSDASVFAAAYVLMRSLEDYQISIDSMDYYLKTAKESETRDLFIRQALEGRWDSIRELKYKFTADEFKAMLLFYNGNVGKGGDITTPDGVSRLAARLMNVKPGMKVLDIGTGTGGFIRECSAVEPSASYVGLEINAELAVVAEIRCEILGIDAQIRLGNVFDGNDLDDKFDVVFANYPMRMSPHSAGTFCSEYINKHAAHYRCFSRLPSLDWVFNRKAYDCVGGPNRVVCIMANNSAWSIADKGVRRYFMELGIVEMVIALPPRIFETTGAGATMIVFSHGNTRTMMVDASDLCEKGRRMNTITDKNIDQILDACNNESNISRFVSFSDIADNQFVLSPTAYLCDDECVNVENGVELGSALSIKRGAQIQAAALDEMSSNTETDYQYLMSANIQNGIIDDELPYLSEIDERLERYCIKNNNLILTKIGAPFKIAVAEVGENQHILANGNLYVMTVDETRADPYYVKAYLESDKGIAALNRISTGATFPTVGVEQLKKLIIPLPPLEEQRKIADEYRACITETKMLRRKLAKTIDRMRHLYDSSKEG